MRKAMMVSSIVLLACGADEAPTLDVALVPAAKGDAGDVSVLRRPSGYDAVLLQGASGRDLFDVLERAGGFTAASQGSLVTLRGAYLACASNGADAACAVYSREVETPADFAATVHGARFASAASELFGALARAEGLSPANVTQVESALIRCGKDATNVWCGFSDAPIQNDLELVTSFKGLEPLGQGYVYEGWLVTPAGPVTAGRFSDPSGNVFTVSADLAADSTLYVLTIEPALNDDPAPSATHVVAGALKSGSAKLTTTHTAALGTAFTKAKGGFILGTPTSAPSDDGNLGVWFVDPSAGPGASLSLPQLPAGWAYEGWAVVNGQPISTGRFTSASGADDDAGGPTAGPLASPPFPGQDFITPPLDLVGATIVISVEPQPDDSPLPFALKPLVGPAQDAGQGVLQPLKNNAKATAITGLASFK